jgi:restriction system protein
VTIAIVIVLVIASLVAFNWYRFGQEEKKQLSLAQQIVASHAEELTVKRKQLTVKERYGLVDTSKWLDEMAFFVSHVVSPQVGGFRGDNLRRIYEAIESATSHFDSLTPQLHPAMDGVEYECFVADLLSSRGWETRLTKGSGDQGVDVIAQKQGIKAVIQCKLYSHPVGNDAVQEVIAGRAFENADFAAVVTNATFTSAARQLASAAHVLLLHHDQLGQLDITAGTTPVPAVNGTPSAGQEDSVIPYAGNNPNPEDKQVHKAVIIATGFVVMTVLVIAIAVFLVGNHRGSRPAVSVAEGANATAAASATDPEPATKPVHHKRAQRAAAAQAQPVQTAASASPTSPDAAEASRNVSPEATGHISATVSPTASDQGNGAATPVSPAAYQRCMDFLRSQGPEGHPGEYSAACLPVRE